MKKAFIEDRHCFLPFLHFPQCHTADFVKYFALDFFQARGLNFVHIWELTNFFSTSRISQSVKMVHFGHLRNFEKKFLVFYTSPPFWSKLLWLNFVHKIKKSIIWKKIGKCEIEQYSINQKYLSNFLKH